MLLGRDAEAFEREELEVGAVVAGRLQPGVARALRDPRRCGHLVERAAFAAAHLVAGEREQVGLDVGFADPVDRILCFSRGDDSAGGGDEDGTEANGGFHGRHYRAGLRLDLASVYSRLTEVSDGIPARKPAPE